MKAPGDQEEFSTKTDASQDAAIKKFVDQSGQAGREKSLPGLVFVL